MWESQWGVTLLFISVLSAFAMSVLRELPFGGRFHRPRGRDFMFEEAMDRSCSMSVTVPRSEIL